LIESAPEVPVAKQNLAPVIRFAPLGELRVYAITETELEQLERGSLASLYLNFALFFWGVAGSLFAALLTATIPSVRVFVVFVVFFGITLVAAVIQTIFWRLHHKSSGGLAKRIRDRMPPPAIQVVEQSVLIPLPEAPPKE
jgi:hypothetical protein